MLQKDQYACIVADTAHTQHTSVAMCYLQLVCCTVKNLMENKDKSDGSDTWRNQGDVATESLGGRAKSQHLGDFGGERTLNCRRNSRDSRLSQRCSP